MTKDTLALRYLFDPMLRSKAKPVGEVTAEIREILQYMMQRMYDEDGCGLAAPQIGIDKRIFVMDMTYKDPNTKPMMMVDPEIIWESAEKVSMPEPCLSLPSLYFDVERPKDIKMRYRDENNVIQEIHATGWVARCMQHERDHLDGKLAIDYLSPLRKKMAIRKVEKYLKYLDKHKALESVPS